MEYVTRVSPAAHHRPPPVSQRTRRRGMSTTTPAAAEQEQEQRRRQALEQEVANLRQQLSDEQTVQQILERALQPSGARSAVLTIPAFIPSKAKELLAELLMVEEEIQRLEEQIQAMKSTTSMPPTNVNDDVSSPRPSADSRHHHPQPPEIKSMFFISQAMAMDGGYRVSPAAVSSSSPCWKKKNNIFAALPPPTARRNYSLDDTSSRTPPENKNNDLMPKKKNNTSKQKQQQIKSPNKVSERIVKCLLCIFIRLLRSASSSSRSGNHQQQQGSFSFRIDTAITNNVVAAKQQDKGRQQDHYGIFAVQDAIVRDLGPYKNLVSFSSSSLDLRGFSSSPLLTTLREMLEALQHLDLRLLSHHQKLAFWINVYNTCIMHGILQHGLPSNADKLLALKNKATINVSGQKFNALVIENFILRQPSSVKEEFWKCDVDVEEQRVRELYGLKSSEPNILFALCCGIRSSPALRIYKADRVAMDLEKAKLEYLQASLVVTSTRRLLIPSLIHSSMHDFAKDMESLLRWICEQLPTSWPLRKSMVDCLMQRGHGGHFKLEDVVDVIPFDYEFQYLLPV